MGLGMTNGPGKTGYYAKQAYDTANAAMAAVESAPALVPATTSRNGYMTKESMIKLEGVENTYLPLAGGIMSGFIRSNGLGVLGTNSAGYNTFHSGSVSDGSEGAYVQVLGKDHPDNPGEFRAAAIKANGSPIYFRGKPDGSLTWNGNELATVNSPALTGTPTAPTAARGTNTTQIATTAFVKDAMDNASYLPLSGGTMTGFISGNGVGMKSSGATSYTTIHGGSLSNGSEGAYVQVLGKSHTSNPGEFVLAAVGTNGGHYLRGKPDGTLKWDTNDIALVNNPEFTGVPKAPTAAAGTNTTQIATTAHVFSAIKSSGYNKKDVIITGGTYTVPVTAMYKITLKGGGGGGCSGGYTSSTSSSGNGGGEGATAITWRKLTAGTSISVVIGAGGSGGTPTVSETSKLRHYGTDGGTTKVTIGVDELSASGGKANGLGGSGDICGAPGQSYSNADASIECIGGSGGGNGGGNGTVGNSPGVKGGGGCGGNGKGSTSTAEDGSPGGNGYVWFEYNYYN